MRMNIQKIISELINQKTVCGMENIGRNPDFPLNIYVKETSSRYYKSAYKDYVKYAMDVWRKADDRIQYKFVKSVDDADIALVFVENLGDKYEENYLGLTDYDTNRNKEIEFSKIQISLIKKRK